ncbi:hypothetical protein LINGRAPRIM_LOCUS1993 [Linum grandiflorum]
MEDLTPELDYDDLMQAIHTDTEMFETNEGPSTSKKRRCSSAGIYIINLLLSIIYFVSGIVSYVNFEFLDGVSNDGITLSENSDIGDGDTDDDFNDGQENIFY